MESREPVVAYGKKKITREEYLEWERCASQKHEYYRGEVFAMAGTGIRHNIIAKNLMINIGAQLKENRVSLMAAICAFTFRKIHYLPIPIFRSFVVI